MDLRNLKQLTIGGVELIQLFINGVEVWKKGFKNWVRHSTESDGTTIYNGGLGYKDGYRVRSGGAEVALTNGACTGFIPVSAGDVVRVSGWSFTHVTAANAINVADSSFANIGQFTSQNSSYGIFESEYAAYGWSSVVEETTGVWKWVVPPAISGVKYIRVSGFDNNGGVGPNMIVTVNEEIEV